MVHSMLFTNCVKEQCYQEQEEEEETACKQIHIYVQAGTHTLTYTIGPDREEDTKEARSLGAAFSICWG